MKEEDVPQDDIKGYNGHRRVVYATDSQTGEYKRVESSGWEVEGFATALAVQEFQQQEQQARQRVLAGLAAPLEFHMYHHRLDIPTLSHMLHIAQWRIRRHFKPGVFNRLKPSMLERYCEIFNISVAELRELPK